MKSNSLKQMAVMNVEKGEEVVGGWASAHIPQVGVYKLLAKKCKDGVIEWAHFVQRDSGLKDKVYRGEVETHEKLDEVLEIMNKHLLRVFGTTMKSADYDMFTLDGKKTSKTSH
jgi:hypothetical protein